MLPRGRALVEHSRHRVAFATCVLTPYRRRLQLLLPYNAPQPTCGSFATIYRPTSFTVPHRPRPCFRPIVPATFANAFTSERGVCRRYLMPYTRRPGALPIAVLRLQLGGRDILFLLWDRIAEHWADVVRVVRFIAALFTTNRGPCCHDALPRDHTDCC